MSDATEPLPSVVPSGRSSARWAVFVGVALAFVGLAVYLTQVSAHRLATPWYLPPTATLGALLIAFALWRRRGVWRVLALGCVLLMAVAEWGFVLGTRLPDYSGPVAVGKPFPHFTTTRSDGGSFTHDDLADQDTALVFFRGRW